MKIGQDCNLNCFGKSIRIAFWDLPEEIGGFSCAEKKPDSYFLVVNSARTMQKQRFSLGHELAHILLGHLDRENREKDIPIGILEAEANKAAWKCYGLFRDGVLTA